MINSRTVTGLIRSLAKTDEELFAEAKKIRGVLDGLLLKHRELSAELGSCHDLQAKDQAEIRRLTGTLYFWSKLFNFMYLY